MSSVIVDLLLAVLIVAGGTLIFGGVTYMAAIWSGERRRKGHDE